MIRTFKVLSVALSYPMEELQESASVLKATLRLERMLARDVETRVCNLLDEFAHWDLYDLQERYVELFDRTRSLCLNLFEHVHGESRDRGQAMVDLRAHYEVLGFTLSSRELPDYLPLFLEFLAMQPLIDARALLAEPLPILTVLRERLDKRRSPYAALIAALECLAADVPDTTALEDLRAAPDDDVNDLAALDAAWHEEPVTFGPASDKGGCPKVGDILKRMEAPLPSSADNIES